MGSEKDETRILFPYNCKGWLDHNDGFTSIIIEVPGRAISEAGFEQLVGQGNGIARDLDSNVLTIVH